MSIYVLNLKIYKKTFVISNESIMYIENKHLIRDNNQLSYIMIKTKYIYSQYRNNGVFFNGSGLYNGVFPENQFYVRNVRTFRLIFC